MQWYLLGNTPHDAPFFAAVLSIIFIDLILAGDNAVVIAMAVRNLPSRQRTRGIILGAGAAVTLRVIATFFVSQVLTVGFVKLAGGAVILWIGTKLFMEGMPDEKPRAATSIWNAVQLIVIADITLSIDNMLAVGGAAHGSFQLLLFGLIVSVPFVVFTSNVLSTLMNRYPMLVAIGAAILGKVGADMIVTDPQVQAHLALGPAAEYGVEAIGALGVLVAGRLLSTRRPAPAPTPGDEVISPAEPAWLYPQAAADIDRDGR